MSRFARASGSCSGPPSRRAWSSASGCSPRASSDDVADPSVSRAAQGHDPVMVREVVELLGGRSLVLDLTRGAGAHAEALLEAGVQRVIGVDRDAAALHIASDRLARFGDRFEG